MIRIAKTENGLVRGLEGADPRITAFKGIPFAAPPVGENRWRAPQPAENWEGIRDAYRFAPDFYAGYAWEWNRYLLQRVACGS